MGCRRLLKIGDILPFCSRISDIGSSHKSNVLAVPIVRSMVEMDAIAVFSCEAPSIIS